MSLAEEATVQLREEAHRRLYPWAALAPGRTIEMALIETTSAAERLVHQLLADEHVAAETAQDLMVALWPGESMPPLDWWRTPLGLLVARAAGIVDDDDEVTHAEAAEILGVARGTVASLVHRGDLERGPTGSVSLRSVLDRLVRRHA